MMEAETCCASGSGGLSTGDANDLATALKALADPVRLRLLSLIGDAPEGSVCACDLTDPLDRSQATVSHHTSVLVAAGFIVREQRGKWAWFSLDPERRDFVRSLLADGKLRSVSARADDLMITQ